MIYVNWVVALAAIIFTVGTIGVMFRRNPLIMFMASEMMWNAAALAFIAYARQLHDMNG
ncbi:MAG: NADH-quinone oxidoreductase subunit K, partial [Sulfobacillus thermotolerans]|nr:NADH-quinone oxidoreductase subunit K [Sulfobacillus thermotolerans]